MEYINPIFNNIKIENNKKLTTIPAKKTLKKRAPRSDKTHNIKFPVSTITQIKLKSLCKQAQRNFQSLGKPPLSQTKFNTLLLRYGLQHEEILSWNHEYKDTKVYMHINLLETEYASMIGGPYGLSIQKNLSDRKVVFHIIQSVLKWIEGEGDIEKIIQ
jgi:hypothetical protein